MQYELSVFQQILSGSLSPLSFILPPKSPTLWNSYLPNLPTTCTKRVHAQFTQEDNRLTTQEVQAHLLDKHQLPAFLALNHTVHPLEDELGENMLTQILATLSLSEKEVQEWYHWQDEGGTLHLELYARFPLDRLSFEEVRYYHYQSLLSIQVARIQQAMVQTIHRTPSAKKTAKYVQDHQQALLTYTNEVLKYLDEEHPGVYTLSGGYTLPDVYKLIFMNLEELIGFVEQQFTQYLDTTAPVPYRHRVVQAAQLLQTLSSVEPVLSRWSASEDWAASGLLSVLQELFNRIRQLPTDPANYLQLRYYQKLLQGLETWVGQEDASEESLLTLLFHLNFNSTGLLHWFISTLQTKLTEKEVVADRLSLLYYYRKFCKQLSVQQQYAYRQGYPSVEERVLSWINEEITYWQQQPVTSESAPTADTDEQQSADSTPLGKHRNKIKTNLSVPQISLLLRMFLDPRVNIFPKQNQNNIYCQISRVLQSTRQEDVSEKSLRDRYYKADQHSVAVLKEKVIAMLNYLNGLS